MSATSTTTAGDTIPDRDVLAGIASRVLWLSCAMVHHANRVRPNSSGVKVGGHQASSASMVSLMTALWFGFLEAPDRVSVKPHASPVLHAINYLLGGLDATYLERLREFGGLQSYPSRTKDPDRVDYSTGSVGLGATAPVWNALAHRYAADHFDVPPSGRRISLIGDAELDEGACWEAIVDPSVARLGEVMWVVDLNRQSLDRVVPDIAAARLASMFEAAGWHCAVAKYGRVLDELFELPGGQELRARIDGMTNEEYQGLLRATPTELRERLPGSGRGRRALTRLTESLEDAQLTGAVRDLGGHDVDTLLGCFREASSIVDRPSVVFAYTIKGWSLPTEGHPANHSALLSDAQMRELALQVGVDADAPWERFPNGTAEAELCRHVAERLAQETPPVREGPVIPGELDRAHASAASTQQAFGRFFVDLERVAPEVSKRIVTVSPDVATSTNLGGWINKAGIWALSDRVDWFAQDTDSLVRWRESAHGQHIELGIAETNLVGLLGELGATWSRLGQPLLPVGTIYDPFVTRAHEPWSFGIYAGGQSILVGTPSGITLGPEGGAHQSIVTPSLGISQPLCTAWEPAFGQDLEWTFLHALSQLGHPDGSSSYFRLSTRPIDQSLNQLPQDSESRARRRREVLAGGYRLAWTDTPALQIAVMGVLVPEALAAAQELEAEVIIITSADLLFRALRAARGLSDDDPWILDELFPSTRPLPIVSVLDGHPHALSFLSAIRGVPMTCLGTCEFGQSGQLDDLYRRYGIDVDGIIGAGIDLLDANA